MQKVLRPNFEKRGGLVTVVAQDIDTREVLMLAYANEEAFRKTLETGIATYYSTSRSKLWMKGEESGNTQKVWSVRVDCDGDAIVYLVEPEGDGVACHTEARSCFYRPVLRDGHVKDEPAPKASTHEELPTIELEVHPDIVSFFPRKRG
ncbi:MAG TPA: phosphoribosyl-AMP cyclohydrolase [Candidatus Paceibacterota bacterium]|nr:phosphoribosyl-AMP cyclohydrolase [Candidatus Paceibacterota bacterium]